MTQQCQFYLEKKRRFCRFDAKPGCLYCGNHLYLATGQGQKRIPCPLDPSHMILESDLEAHLKKCPKAVLEEERKSTPTFVEDLNAGIGDDAELPIINAPRKGRVRSAQRAALANSIGLKKLSHLIGKVEDLWDRKFSVELDSRFLQPVECDPFMKSDGERPFSKKHAIQQASLIGNMMAHDMFGSASSLLIEFGAGRGYLSSMISDATPIRNFILLDCSGPRLKADRSLRKSSKIQFKRIRMDIKDFDVTGLAELQSNSKQLVSNSEESKSNSKELMSDLEEFNSNSKELLSNLEESKSNSKELMSNVEESKSNSKQLVSNSEECKHNSKELMSNLGNLKSWIGCGKHLCGAATDFTLRACEHGSGNVQRVQNGVGEFKGVATATCCHHRCGWKSYVGQEMFKNEGFSPTEFELVSWMTGWALCGHGGGGGSSCSDTSDDNESTISNEIEPLMAFTRINDIMGDIQGVSEGDVWRVLPRPYRMSVGDKCKRLIDEGRLHWMKKQGYRASLLQYVPSSVSPENRLLIGVPGRIGLI